MSAAQWAHVAREGLRFFTFQSQRALYICRERSSLWWESVCWYVTLCAGARDAGCRDGSQCASCTSLVSESTRQGTDARPLTFSSDHLLCADCTCMYCARTAYPCQIIACAPCLKQPEPLNWTYCLFSTVTRLSRDVVEVWQFLQPDAVRWRGICYGDVAVCVSVTLMYFAQTTEPITVWPSPDCSSATVFPHEIWTR